MYRWVWLTLVAITLAGCSHGRYQLAQDQAPPRLPTAAELVEPEPRFEPLALRGNAPYEVFGEHYEVLPTAKGYEATGLASWYGKKFHGHQTSSGEYYDMYSISAAHRELPLPSFVRVTNLDNDRELIVRVNDRGPFHPDRVIDLSYGAAYQLGVIETGTAPVHLEAIYMPGPTLPEPTTQRLAETPRATASDAEDLNLAPTASFPIPESTSTAHAEPPATSASSSTPLTQYYIQLAATGDRERLQDLQQELQKSYPFPATTRAGDGLYRLLLGPFPEPQSQVILEQIRTTGFTEAFRVAQASFRTEAPE